MNSDLKGTEDILIVLNPQTRMIHDKSDNSWRLEQDNATPAQDTTEKIHLTANEFEMVIRTGTVALSTATFPRKRMTEQEEIEEALLRG